MFTAKNAEIIETITIPKDGPCKPRDVFGDGEESGLVDSETSFV